jgi:hypothetical protein
VSMEVIILGIAIKWKLNNSGILFPLYWGKKISKGLNNLILNQAVFL